MKVRPNQVWVDKKSGNKLVIRGRHQDKTWNGVLLKSGINHKMREHTLKRYFTLTNEKIKL